VSAGVVVAVATEMIPPVNDTLVTPVAEAAIHFTSVPVLLKTYPATPGELVPSHRGPPILRYVEDGIMTPVEGLRRMLSPPIVRLSEASDSTMAEEPFCRVKVPSEPKVREDLRLIISIPPTETPPVI